MKRLYELSDKTYDLVDSPDTAEIILIGNMRGGRWGEQTLSHPLINSNPGKCFSITDSDEPLTLHHGIYASARKSILTMGRVRTGSYALFPDEYLNPYVCAHAISDQHDVEKTYLLSFIGRKISPVREIILSLTFERNDIFVRDSTEAFDLWNLEKTGERLQGQKHYYDVLVRSKFSLCPRGAGASSQRLFESLQVGVAPVILSDKWIFPRGPRWGDFSIVLKEKHVRDVERIVRSYEKDYKKMGSLARKAFEQYFADGVYFNYVVSNCIDIGEAQLVPEALYWKLNPVFMSFRKLRGRVRRRIARLRQPPVDLHRTFPRRFVPAGTSMADWPAIERLGATLLARECASPAELERWLEDASELAACVDEEWARRDIAFTAKTDDPVVEQSRLTWIREIRPRWQKLCHQFEAAYLASPQRYALPRRYRVFDRLTDNRRALYREDNLSLIATAGELTQAYEKRRAAMTIMYEGREYTPQQAVLFLESPERALRQTVWTLLAEGARAERDAFDELFDRLLAIRSQIARNAGLASYREYAFRALDRFDYGMDECTQFHDAVEAHFVPLASRIARERCALMGLARLRPWDEDVDPLGRAPLLGFERVENLLDRCEAVFRAIAPEFGDYVRFMREQRLFDLDRRKHKAPGAYCRPLEERRWPFVFSNVRPARGVPALFHECGHAFRYILVREEPLMTYRSAPADFEEVASTSMELLTAPYLHLVYDAPGDAARAYRALLDGIVTDMPRVAMVDAFQHWLYTHPAHTANERREAWTALYRRFHPDVDWSGYEDVLASWHAEPGGAAIFLRPFHFIEYGISLLGALQLWRRAIGGGDMAGAVASYRSALALGGSRPLPELFETAELHFAFGAETVAAAAASLAQSLDKMPYAGHTKSCST